MFTHGPLPLLHKFGQLDVFLKTVDFPQGNPGYVRELLVPASRSQPFADPCIERTALGRLCVIFPYRHSEGQKLCRFGSTKAGVPDVTVSKSSPWTSAAPDVLHRQHPVLRKSRGWISTV